MNFSGKVYSSDPKVQPVNSVQYDLRMEENADFVMVIADKSTAKTDDDGFVEVIHNCESVVLSQYDKTSQTISNIDLIKYLGEHDHCSYWSKNDSMDSVDALMLKLFPDFYIGKDFGGNHCIDVNEVIDDFVRRVVFLKHKMLFKVGECILSYTPHRLLNYINDLDTIEKYCLVMDPAMVRNQIDEGTLKIYEGGKKLKSIMGIPTDIVLRIDKYGSSDAVPAFQNYLQKNLGSADEIRWMLDWIDALQKLSRKRKISFYAGVDSGTINKIGEIIECGYTITTTINAVSREIFMYDVSENVDVNSILREIKDTIDMQQKAGIFSTKIGQNINKWHFITSRNCDIISKPRTEEYKAAIEKINKRSMVVDQYLIKCPETEEELFNIGDAYNDCLLIYRDKIIDNGAIIYSMYPLDAEGNPVDGIPPITFEVTQGLDFVQVKTFNDVDVTDKAVLETLNKWRTAIRRKEAHSNG